MTYPPQQQPDPWGQQPPQEPWGQQQDQWGQQPPPPQDPWGGGGGGYDGYGPPPKKGGGKTVAIVLIIVVVLAGAGVGLFFWLKKDDGNTAGGPGLNPNDPKSVAVAWADKYSKAYNTGYQEVKAADLKPLMCQSQYKGLDKEQAEADRSRTQNSSNSALPTSRHRTYKLDIGEVKVSGETATVMVTATQLSGSTGPSSASSQARTETRAFDMKKENGGWKVCGPQAASNGGASPSGGANPPLPGSGSGGTSGTGGVPAPSSSLKPLPSGIPLPTH